MNPLAFWTCPTKGCSSDGDADKREVRKRSSDAPPTSLSHLCLLPQVHVKRLASLAAQRSAASVGVFLRQQDVTGGKKREIRALSKLKIIIYLIRLPLPSALSVQLMWDTRWKREKKQSAWAAAHVFLCRYNHFLWKCGSLDLHGFHIWQLG